jgi:hypothetical protein
MKRLWPNLKYYPTFLKELRKPRRTTWIVGVAAEILTLYLTNTSIDSYHFTVSLNVVVL